ncbi:MAG: twin-arginine translocase TatA/TatE family subunit [Terriglobales bacterium]
MSFGELLFLAILALLVFGPRKLPEIARTVARVMADLRRAGNEFRYSLEDELHTVEMSDPKPSRKLQPVPAAAEGAVPRVVEITSTTAELPAPAAPAAAPGDDHDEQQDISRAHGAV